jgi:hypothetical protein
MYHLLSGFHEGLSSYRRSLQPPKENILHAKHEENFVWVIFAFPDPEPI